MVKTKEQVKVKKDEMFDLREEKFDIIDSGNQPTMLKVLNKLNDIYETLEDLTTRIEVLEGV